MLVFFVLSLGAPNVLPMNINEPSIESKSDPVQVNYDIERALEECMYEAQYHKDMQDKAESIQTELYEALSETSQELEQRKFKMVEMQTERMESFDELSDTTEMLEQCHRDVVVCKKGKESYKNLYEKGIREQAELSRVYENIDIEKEGNDKCTSRLQEISVLKEKNMYLEKKVDYLFKKWSDLKKETIETKAWPEPVSENASQKLEKCLSYKENYEDLLDQAEVREKMIQDTLDDMAKDLITCEDGYHKLLLHRITSPEVDRQEKHAALLKDYAVLEKKKLETRKEDDFVFDLSKLFKLLTGTNQD